MRIMRDARPWRNSTRTVQQPLGCCTLGPVSGPARLQPPDPWHEPKGRSMRSLPYLGYLRVSTDEQANSGLGLEAQRAAILAEAQRRGWAEADVQWIEDAGYSGKDTRRPGIRLALEVLKRGEAAGLVVAKMDRLS